MAKANYIKIAKKAAATQISELRKVNKIFDKNFIQAINIISNCKGKIILSGQGKSGRIAAKISSTLSSVGIPSFYVHPSETTHGDSGAIEKKDVLIIVSYSGNTPELTGILKYANRFGIKIIGCASKKDSMLLKASDIKILLPKVREADPTGMVPTSSTTLTLLYFDCLAVALMNKLKFSKDKFKIYHSGGNIGKNLLLVKDIMITGNKLPTISINKSINDAIKIINKKKLGLVVVINKGFVSGLITDGDCRRAIKNLKKSNKIENFMSRKPMFISENVPASKALSVMSENKITSLCVPSEKTLNKKNKKLKAIVHVHRILDFGVK
jgi:arabinose-5-phosphate isomerase|tara:strand:- start:301 stop:1278 length:978 start_codon:yes stop_codon:yes gene_type:complete